MSRVFFTSDWHCAHKNIVNFDKNFKSAGERFEFLCDKYSHTVRKNDTVYFHGDMIFDRKTFDIFSKLQGRKILILGNHCTDGKNRVSIAEQCEVFDGIHGLISYKKTWLSHAPIHPDELRGKCCIHGHTHSYHINDDRYLNVCVENWNYTPVSAHTIKDIFKGRDICVFPKLN